MTRKIVILLLVPPLFSLMSNELKKEKQKQQGGMREKVLSVQFSRSVVSDSATP